MKYSANSVWENKDAYDIVVVGAGHAGCEAAGGKIPQRRGTQADFFGFHAALFLCSERVRGYNTAVRQQELRLHAAGNADLRNYTGREPVPQRGRDTVPLRRKRVHHEQDNRAERAEIRRAIYREAARFHQF